ncbi:Uncharacterised protein [Raoultella terrigena]|uniref:Uncharacterized protein n=1 Tax=Raoultella terrigena TaxID=577 RepID=A0A4V6J1A8_RAOTE|nr:Uncharacterised protein [Raoultella terrigena]
MHFIHAPASAGLLYELYPFASALTTLAKRPPGGLWRAAAAPFSINGSHFNGDRSHMIN